MAPEAAWADPAPARLRAEQAWAQAVAAKEAGDDPHPALIQAEAASRSVLARRPLDAGAALLLARSLLGQGERAEAAAAAEAALLAYPSAPAGWLRGPHRPAGRRRRRGGRPGAGLALNLPGKDDARPLIAQALAEEAEPARMADRLLPDRADRLRDGGALLAAGGDRAFAEGLFERAVALDPATGVAYGRWLVAWGEGARALVVLRAVPKPACRAHLFTGQAANLTGDSAAAMRAFRRAQASCTDSELAEARRGLDHAGALAGDRQALARLEAEQQRNPGDTGLLRLLIVAHGQGGRLEAQRDALEALVLSGEALPAEIDAWRSLAALPPGR